MDRLILRKLLWPVIWLSILDVAMAIFILTIVIVVFLSIEVFVIFVKYMGLVKFITPLAVMTTLVCRNVCSYCDIHDCHDTCIMIFRQSSSFCCRLSDYFDLI